MAATMTAAAAPAILNPAVGMGAAAPMKLLTTGATGVEEWTWEVRVVGATGIGVVGTGVVGTGVVGTGVVTGAAEDQSPHWLVTGTGAGATELDQSPH